MQERQKRETKFSNLKKTEVDKFVKYRGKPESEDEETNIFKGNS